MPNNRFLIVEFSGEGITLAEWTRDHPGTTVDVISEPVRREGKDNLHPSLFMVKGADRASLVQVMERLDRVHGPIQSLRVDPVRGQWLGRMTIKESQLKSTTAAAIAQFQHRFGAPWTHLENGVVYMRARLPEKEDSDRLLKQLQGYMAHHQVEAQATVEELSTHDYGVWDDLVQASIGMAP